MQVRIGSDDDIFGAGALGYFTEEKYSVSVPREYSAARNGTIGAC